ncbi:hypothetical protein Ade02nite_42040 [Paractinoplanes deccanensis]|uniref:DUF4178 domain-containing protein n=1 Tax=Paractinoplanes deccanensis TaxID=113561 RepID=A0ABQ3Y6E0_9ACTN|nr:hypothetical protein [Actinoplanes deccanensis]GID75563.1 hypothetical protein Ade02nite_42040 [Actinoplanes deccanensis]
MSFLRRRPSLPAALKPALAPDERVVAWAAVDEDQAVVVTNHGLFLPGAEERLGWHEIHKAAWSGRELRITPAEVAEERDGYTVMVDGPVRAFLLLDPGEVPDQVRMRVSKSVAYTHHHPVQVSTNRPDKPFLVGGVRVVGRRVTGRDGLSWAVRYDSGTPVSHTTVVEVTETLVSAARESMTAPD